MVNITYENLRILMVKKKIEFKDFHAALGFSSHTISKLKRDEPVSLEVISKLCNFFHCNMSDLMDIVYFDEYSSVNI